MGDTQIPQLSGEEGGQVILSRLQAAVRVLIALAELFFFSLVLAITGEDPDEEVE